MATTRLFARAWLAATGQRETPESLGRAETLAGAIVAIGAGSIGGSLAGLGVGVGLSLLGVR